jgi:membrane protein implicated in regulation of membrane protease activity
MHAQELATMMVASAFVIEAMMFLVLWGPGGLLAFVVVTTAYSLRDRRKRWKKIGEEQETDRRQS